MFRKLLPRQRTQIWIYDTVSNSNALLYETDRILFEAPNWSLDGESLIVNGDGVLWRLPIAAPAPTAIAIKGLPPVNNDHVLDPDGEHIFISTYETWQIYRAPLAGGAAVQVTGREGPAELKHFLHGVSPDGKRLSFVGLKADTRDGEFRIFFSAIFTIGADGTDLRQLTASDIPVDGPEFSPEGKWIYFNTEAFTGHAQIARMRIDGTGQERLSFSETVDWFPHLAPDGKAAVYLAFPPGTRGHPADLDVGLKLVRHGDWANPLEVARLPGGQGTINVNSWSPDSRRFAYVAYPFK